MNERQWECSDQRDQPRDRPIPYGDRCIRLHPLPPRWTQRNLGRSNFPVVSIPHRRLWIQQLPGQRSVLPRDDDAFSLWQLFWQRAASRLTS